MILQYNIPYNNKISFGAQHCPKKKQTPLHHSTRALVTQTDVRSAPTCHLFRAVQIQFFLSVGEWMGIEEGGPQPADSMYGPVSCNYNCNTTETASAKMVDGRCHDSIRRFLHTHTHTHTLFPFKGWASDSIRDLYYYALVRVVYEMSQNIHPPRGVGLAYQLDNEWKQDSGPDKTPVCNPRTHSRRDHLPGAAARNPIHSLPPNLRLAG